MAFDLDGKFLRAAEEKLGCQFPDSFGLAMQENNGGCVIADDDEWQLHPIFDTSDRQRIGRTCNDVTRETETMKNWPGWPENAIAIGANGLGDAIVFLCQSGRCDPHIYKWSHETGELTLLASDFAEVTRVD